MSLFLQLHFSNLSKNLESKALVLFLGFLMTYETQWWHDGTAEDLWSPATYLHFGAVGQGVFKRDAQGEVVVLGTEGAGLVDVELVSVLLDGDLQVVVLG